MQYVHGPSTTHLSSHLQGGHARLYRCCLLCGQRKWVVQRLVRWLQPDERCEQRFDLGSYTASDGRCLRLQIHGGRLDWSRELDARNALHPDQQRLYQSLCIRCRSNHFGCRLLAVLQRLFIPCPYVQCHFSSGPQWLHGRSFHNR